MKNVVLSSWEKTLVTLCLGIIMHGGLFAQCNTLSTRTYDTVITGPGYGTYNISFPKWNIDSGLLVSVKISAIVNVQYGYSLKNTDVTSGTYKLMVGREDYFTSSALSGSYDTVKEQQIGMYTLNPGDQVVEPPFPFLDNYVISDSITGATAPFLGSGMVSFTYAPITYTSIRMTNASYGYHAAASEITHFTLTYLYCNGDGILATDVSDFAASMQSPTTVLLNWNTSAEQIGRTYEIQRSRDGISFTTIGYKPADSTTGMANYSYVDTPGDGGKWYYRLRLVSENGISYTPIRAVVLPSAGGHPVIFPNPAIDHIDVVLPGGGGGDLLVNLYAADGRRVQADSYAHTRSFSLFFRENLSAGVYYVEVRAIHGTYKWVFPIQVRKH